MSSDYLELNKKSWNSRVDAHLKSEFYDLEGFLHGNTSLNSIESELLGDVQDLSILHLQCHFGQDTISMSRLGAQTVGVDLSDKAIEAAKDLAKKTDSNASFVCADVYDLPNHLDQTFDMVFTSYGTIGWLPDMNKWAQVVSRFLKPGGRFIIVEFHPVVWMFDDDFKTVGYNYFNDGEITGVTDGTYADKSANIQAKYVSWNHSISEVTNALIKNGLEINALDEFDYSPYDVFRHTVEVAPKKFRIQHLDNKIPMVYAISATKKA